jgi:ABC-type lipoprotein release transport system permease subunit
LVLRQGLSLTAAGIGLGILGSVFLSRLIERVLFGVEPLDPRTLAAAPAILMAVALTACLQPAWRACRADPAETLHHD